MPALAGSLISLLLALGWVWMLRRSDRVEPEPWPIIVRTYLLGALAVLPALALEAPLRSLLAGNGNGWEAVEAAVLGAGLLAGVVAVGLIEEGVKWLAAWQGAFRSLAFSQVVDGLVYGGVAGLGFATAENLLYGASLGWSVGPLRSLVTSWVHAAFSGLAGLGTAWSRFRGPGSRAGVGLFVAAVVLHAAYNLVIITGLMTPLVLLATVFGLVFFLFRTTDQLAGA
ncbi:MULTISPECIES: PrsW family intramembrane metalloprotease [Limnochorda]|uniref:PrsW family intramembrane metalloprotease n=1 Tax=Limnochorda TaxID=1676651 RepID=UPI001D946712|nr:PrsW family glutamic-type intramembrane protease [Limnochorda pilosa]MBO2487118.1 hypothetical protein [Bacillota bacterium]MBO2519947.1 hypothetical protein [Bacillota bacterium]